MNGDKKLIYSEDRRTITTTTIAQLLKARERERKRDDCFKDRTKQTKCVKLKAEHIFYMISKDKAAHVLKDMRAHD